MQAMSNLAILHQSEDSGNTTFKSKPGSSEEHPVPRLSAQVLRECDEIERLVGPAEAQRRSENHTDDRWIDIMHIGESNDRVTKPNATRMSLLGRPCYDDSTRTTLLVPMFGRACVIDA